MQTTSYGFNPSERKFADFGYPKQPFIERLGYALRVLPRPFALDSILAVDLSHWNGEIDWMALVNSGVEVVILKCSEGWKGSYWEYKDVKFEENWRAALHHGLTVVVYHFYRDGKGSAEKSWFMECADNYLNDPRIDGHTAVFLDVETDNGVDINTRANRAFGFCSLIEGEGFRQGIYSSPGLVDRLFPRNDPRWNDVFQWNAHWTSAPQDTLPSGWTEIRRIMWQFGIYPTHSWAPTVNGAGTVDVNHLYFPTVLHFRDWLGFQEFSYSPSASASPSPSLSPSPSYSPSPSSSPPVDCCDDHELRIATLEAGQTVLTQIQQQQEERIAALEQQIKFIAEDVGDLELSVDSLNIRVDNLWNNVYANTSSIESLDTRVTGQNMRLLAVEEAYTKMKKAMCGDE
jgi:GH25 family lysozyme M1 (1,4-beta-N-acetylmuramidase)